MKTLSAGVEIIFKDKQIEKAERYRVEDNSLNNVKDLLKKEIDNIDKKIHLYNVISIKFTG